MKARDIMTTDVVSVGPEASPRAVAKLLADRGISAVPVVDAVGAPIGMISEGDLIGRNDGDRRARRDWWLTLFAEGEALNPNFLATLREPEPLAQVVMTSPVVTVSEDTETSEIARLLVSHHIKRVPVIRDSRMVGIVSRADLVKAMAADATTKAAPPRHGGLFAEAIAGIEDQFRHHNAPDLTKEAARSSSVADETELTVNDFRALVADHEQRKTAHDRADRCAVVEHRRHHIAELIDRHISDAGWRQLVHQAHDAAERGEREFLLLQFPSGLCSDGGRCINAGQQGWPRTLRGEAADLYLRWELELKPRGFRMIARVLDFPGGMPGDIGLFLDWTA